LRDEEKIEFLHLFGADAVTCLSSRGQLKHCCFLQFADEPSAKQALSTLHQFEVLGKRLIVEYAKPAHVKLANGVQTRAVLEKVSNVDSSQKTSNETEKKKNGDSMGTGISPQLGVNHDLPGHLNYMYPAPSVTVLTNIANAMAAVPKFYTQVLHLMNKMNLPPPFSGPTPSPPMPGDSTLLRDASVDTSDLAEYFASSEESELESDAENSHDKEARSNLYTSSNVTEPVRKKRRLKTAPKSDQEKQLSFKLSKVVSAPIESAFELPTMSKRVDGKLAASIKQAVDRTQAPPVSYQIFDERDPGFGKIDPVRPPEAEVDVELGVEVGIESNVPQEMEESEQEEEEEEETSEYISIRQLKENRISEAEILSMSQFKNYTRGERTNRLYIKNLAKQVSEQDLKFIFQRFVKDLTEGDENLLEIRVMQEGRMKGQAFITFPSDETAEKALSSTHGYVLHAKPMIIQYGRSAKPK